MTIAGSSDDCRFIRTVPSRLICTATFHELWQLVFAVSIRVARVANAAAVGFSSGRHQFGCYHICGSTISFIQFGWPPPAEGPPSTGEVQSCLHTLCSPGAASGTERGHSTAQHMLHGRVFGFSGADGCSPNPGLRYPTPPDFGHPATHHLIGQKWAGRNLGRIETSTPRFVLALSPGGQVGSCTSRASNGPRFVNQPSL